MPEFNLDLKIFEDGQILHSLEDLTSYFDNDKYIYQDVKEVFDEEKGLYIEPKSLYVPYINEYQQFDTVVEISFNSELGQYIKKYTGIRLIVAKKDAIDHCMYAMGIAIDNSSEYAADIYDKLSEDIPVEYFNSVLTIREDNQVWTYAEPLVKMLYLNFNKNYTAESKYHANPIEREDGYYAVPYDVDVEKMSAIVSQISYDANAVEDNAIGDFITETLESDDFRGYFDGCRVITTTLYFQPNYRPDTGGIATIGSIQLVGYRFAENKDMHVYTSGNKQYYEFEGNCTYVVATCYAYNNPATRYWAKDSGHQSGLTVEAGKHYQTYVQSGHVYYISVDSPSLYWEGELIPISSVSLLLFCSVVASTRLK